MARGIDLLGTFELDPDGYIYFESVFDLKVVGAISPGDFVEQIPPSPLRGEAISGEKICLLGTICVSSTTSSGGLGRLRLLVNQLVIGVSEIDVKTPLIESVVVSPAAP
jgi:hypothetical protein